MNRLNRQATEEPSEDSTGDGKGEGCDQRQEEVDNWFGVVVCVPMVEQSNSILLKCIYNMSWHFVAPREYKSDLLNTDKTEKYRIIIPLKDAITEIYLNFFFAIQVM